MKVTMANPQREDGYTFISHMVQMKESKNSQEVLRDVYFISHMVQMKGHFR